MAKPLPYPENPGQTHWQGCFRYPKHHNCAVREVDKLREGIDSILRHLIAAGPIPEREKWLWESQRALTSLLRGLEDAAAGRLTDGPDLEADAKLIEDMEKSEDHPLRYVTNLLAWLGDKMGL